MRRYFNVDIEFMDKEDSVIILDVDMVRNKEGVLSLYRKEGPLDTVHLGSYPLWNIRRWVVIEK